MICSPKTMLKIGTVIAVPLAVVFIALPQFRGAILGLAPFALFALCPLGMFFGAKGMMDKDSNTCEHCGKSHLAKEHNIKKDH